MWNQRYEQRAMTMNESEARDLVREVNRTTPWVGVLDPSADKRSWWVKAHHPAMRLVAAGHGKPFPYMPLTSREDWLQAHARWG